MALTDTIALTKLSEVKGDLGITDTSKDAVIERMILAASEAIQVYCDRKFRKETVAEKHRPSGTLRLVLDRTPIVSLTTIDDDGSAIDMTTVGIEHAGAGIIRKDSPWVHNDTALADSVAVDRLVGTGEKVLTVTYVAGYVLPNDATGTRNLPYDIEEACLDAVVTNYRKRGVDSTIISETVGDASQTFSTTGDSVGRLLPPSVLTTLNRYKNSV